MKTIRYLGFLAILLYGANTAWAGVRGSDFRMTVTWDAEQVRLTCTAECEWSELAFDYVRDQPVFVDNRGVTERDSAGSGIPESMTPFVISITRRREGVSLEGIEGTHWSRLGFSCGRAACNQAINKAGMTR